MGSKNVCTSCRYVLSLQAEEPLTLTPEEQQALRKSMIQKKPSGKLPPKKKSPKKKSPKKKSPLKSPKLGRRARILKKPSAVIPTSDDPPGDDGGDEDDDEPGDGSNNEGVQQRALGCSRCRFTKTGCSQCRNPAYRPRGPRS